METPRDTIDVRELAEQQVLAAKQYRHRFHFRPIPLYPGTKQAAVPWKRFQAEHPTDAEIEAMFATPGLNIALVCGTDFVVVDVDDPRYLDDVLDHCGETPMRCKTPSGGFHLYYRRRGGVNYGGSVRIKGMAVDLRAERQYIVVPWSRTKEGVPYEWIGSVLPADSLPLLKVSWLRERSPRRSPASIGAADLDLDAMVRRARAWVATVEGAVSGQGGHNRTFRVACKVTHLPPRGFGLPFDAAMQLMQEFNEACEPKWTIKELEHKVRDAIRVVTEKRA